jgi:hypothetical protein
MDSNTPSATANRECRWKTCAEAADTTRVRGSDGNADPNGDNTAVTVDVDAGCLCAADQDGVLGVVPSTTDLSFLCTARPAGAVEHEMMVTLTWNIDFTAYEALDATNMAGIQGGAAGILWGISGLEAAHVKFEMAEAATVISAGKTDLTFKLVFASKDWADTVVTAVTAVGGGIAGTDVLAVSYTDPTEVVLDATARNGVGALAIAAVATALLM